MKASKEYLEEHVVESLSKETERVVREIFKKLEKVMAIERCDPDVMACFNDYRWIDEGDWQALKDEYIKEVKE